MKMRAIVTDPTIPEHLVLREVDAPCPLPHEALVRVQALSLNRGDVRNALAATTVGRPGWDLAGIVKQAAADGSGPRVGARRDHPTARPWYLSVIVASVAALAATLGRWRWIAVLLRVLVGLDFLGSVGDRFGLLGPPGAAGVSWGDFSNFVTYTHQVNAFLPASVAPALAVLATIAEISLGLGLVLGVRVRLAAVGASLLLLTYGTAMTISLGVASQFPYAVFLLSAGAWALATVDARPLSVDVLVARLRPREGTG